MTSLTTVIVAGCPHGGEKERNETKEKEGGKRNKKKTCRRSKQSKALLFSVLDGMISCLSLAFVLSFDVLLSKQGGKQTGYDFRNTQYRHNSGLVENTRNDLRCDVTRFFIKKGEKFYSESNEQHSQ